MALKRETLEEQIKKRAKERTQKRISVFKEEVARATAKLLERNVSIVHGKCLNEDARKVLSVMASDNHREGWPKTLWQDEEFRVTNEVMGTMDELQKVLLSRDIATEDSPVADEEL